MEFDRRTLLAALGFGVAAGTAAYAQEQAPSQQDLAARLAARAQETRHRLDFDGARFSGPAWDLLLNEGRQAQFLCIGEEHGIAENPKWAAQLFGALNESGYSKACVEISPPMAGDLDRAARNGVEGLRQLFADLRANVAFFGMREEAEWIAAARAAVGGRDQAIWGLDYEVGGTGRLLQRLAEMRKPRAAMAPFQTLYDAAEQAMLQYQASHNPQFIFSFSGDAALVRAVREAWPRPNAEAAWMLETLEETLAINRLWVDNQGWASNQRRAEFNRANFRRYWEGEERKPKVLFKFGASHMVRGLSHTQVFDIGAQVSELAHARGEKSFHLMVLPGASAQVAQFDPSAWTYRPGDVGTYEDQGMTPLISAAHPDAFTLIDLRPLRPLVFGRRHKALDADLVRAVHGFDALLVMSGSTPSANL